MIYVTGDLHADLTRLKKNKTVRRMKKNDTLIVCGDFGFVWDGSKKEQRVLKWLGRRRYHLLFVEGTHDNLDLLGRFPEVSCFGAKARQISGRCHQLLRGEIYTIESDKIFAFGGGESMDMDTRVPGVSWWQSELPSQEEMDYARANLEKNGNVVDYIITHDASAIVNSFLDMDNTHTNQLWAFFDELSQKVRYKQWFVGNFHIDKVIPPKHRVVYQEVLPLKAL